MKYRNLMLIGAAACVSVLAGGLAAAQEQAAHRGINSGANHPYVPPGADPEIEINFDRNKGALYALYGRALRDNPKLEGKVVFEFTIQTGGETTGCRIVSSELHAPELEQKLCARVNLIRFKPRDAAKTATKVVDFFPAA